MVSSQKQILEKYKPYIIELNTMNTMDTMNTIILKGMIEYIFTTYEGERLHHVASTYVIKADGHYTALFNLYKTGEIVIHHVNKGCWIQPVNLLEKPMLFHVKKGSTIAVGFGIGKSKYSVSGDLVFEFDHSMR